MDTLREVLDSLKVHVRDRVSNPLYGAFLVSWVVFNYRLLLVLIGEGTWRDKITFIDLTLYPTAEFSFQRGLVFPLLTSAIFVILAPFIRRWVTVFIAERDAVTSGELLRIKRETPLAPDAADALRRSLFDERQRRIDETRKLEAQVAELNTQVDLLVRQNNQPREAAQTALRLPTPDPESTPQPRVFKMMDSDFVGVAAKYVDRVVELGLTHDQARALYAVRNETQFGVEFIRRALGFTDAYAARVMVDRLNGLGLVAFSQGVAGQFVITSLGRQALDAANARGFDPSEVG